MKMVRYFILFIILITSCRAYSQTVNAEVSLPDNVPVESLNGFYFGFSFGFPGMANINAGYLWQDYFFMGTLSYLPVGMVAFHAMAVLDADEVDTKDDQSVPPFVILGNEQVYLGKIIVRKEKHILALGIAGGAFQYYMDGKKDTINTVYCGPTLNWIYKNLFLEAGIVYVHDFKNNNTFTRLHFSPVFQIGYTRKH